MILYISNPTHGEVYSVQHYVIKLISDLQQVCDFFQFPLYWNIVESGIKHYNPNPIIS